MSQSRRVAQMKNLNLSSMTVTVKEMMILTIIRVQMRKKMSLNVMMKADQREYSKYLK